MKKTILLTLAMCLSLFAFSALAAESPPSMNSFVQKQTVRAETPAVNFTDEKSVRNTQNFRVKISVQKFSSPTFSRNYGERAKTYDFPWQKQSIAEKVPKYPAEVARIIYDLPPNERFLGFGVENSARAKI